MPLFGLLLWHSADAQCTQQVVHLSGTEVLSGTSVTVTSDGYVDDYDDYCMATLPYYIGMDLNTGSCGDGAYSFHFDPPASAVDLKISAMSYVNPTLYEEVRLFLNGSHYDIPVAGTSNGCDNLAVLTVNNDIGAVADAYGWNMTVPGPVTDLRVLNYMPFDCAAGSLFALYFCPGPVNTFAQFVGDSLGCAPFTYTPSLNEPQAGYAYLWDFGLPGDADTSSAQDPVYMYNTPGTYQVTLIATDTVLNVTTSTTEQVIVYPQPVVDLGPDTTFCGDPVNLSWDVTSAGASYAWSTGSALPTLTITGPGTYSVIISNPACSASDTIMADFVPRPDLGPDQVFCSGDSAVLQGGPADAWLWSTGATSSTLAVLTTGTYWLERMDGPCALRDTVQILVNPTPVVDLGPDRLLCDDEVLALNVSVPNGTYLWTDGSTDPSRIFNEAVETWVVVAANGCSGTDSVIITVEECLFQLVMPNVFSPNNDAENPYFTPIIIKGVKSLGLRVWNRWGQEVYTTTDMQFAWNGKKGTDPLPEGIYYWVLQYAEKKSAIMGEMSGTVTLLR
jgi:gliding motility-associated-like protein